MHVVPITLREANAFVEQFHRHLGAVVGHRFSLGAAGDDGLVGVAIVGRPLARLLDDGDTAEVTRCCVRSEAPKGACSFLYARCWRVWQAMGGRKLVTYTLASESGASLRGAGWRVVGQVARRSPGTAWTAHDRDRDWQPIYGQLKLRWERAA